MQNEQQPSEGRVPLGEEGESVAQLAWLGPRGPTLLAGDSRVQPDTRYRPPQMAVRREKKQQARFGTTASPGA